MSCLKKLSFNYFLKLNKKTSKVVWIDIHMDHTKILKKSILN